jgi:septum formation protein
VRDLVLASTSPWRRELLERLGLAFDAVDPELDEDPWKKRGLEPDRLVVALAEAKAQAGAALRPDALVLGSDQVACIDGLILGKPGTTEAACAQLRLLSGRTHRLLTGLALLDARSGSVRTALDVHEVTVRELSDAAIRSYVERDQPLSCAGSYKVESLGIALFERVRGDDYTAVIGLPLTAVVRLLLQAGIDPLDPCGPTSGSDADPR